MLHWSLKLIISSKKKNLGRKDIFSNLRRKYKKKSRNIFQNVFDKKEVKTYKKEGSSFPFISIKKEEVFKKEKHTFVSFFF